MRRFNWQINQLQVHLAGHAVRDPNLLDVVDFGARIDALDVRAERGQAVALGGDGALAFVGRAEIILHAPIAFPVRRQTARAAGLREKATESAG